MTNEIIPIRNEPPTNDRPNRAKALQLIAGAPVDTLTLTGLRDAILAAADGSILQVDITTTRESAEERTTQTVVVRYDARPA